jgi:septal ring factor EnvC (AmiA/AmiB activator)
LGTGSLAAQEESLQRQIQESQVRLEEIRSERERLQSEMEGLRARVQNVSRELRNVERQLSASRSVLQELDFQSGAMQDRIGSTTEELVQTRERLRERKAVLHRRLRDVYKLGPLHTVRVLLSAESFSDLLNRYRYLRMIAAYDRNLVDRVSMLEGALTGQNRELQSSLRELGRLRQLKLGEVAELRSVESQHQETLERFRSRERQAMTRLDQLEADATRMTEMVDDLERRRREAERRRTVAGRGGPEAATLATGDAGSLDWPVDGQLIYRFGRERRPNGTVLRWNGIGIAAEPGTPVHAVRGGTVLLAGPFEGYGPTVIVSHGDGFYTLYLYLEQVGVVEGRTVERGQVVGTVGGRDTPEGPHIEFQIRAPVNGGSPRAMDPLRWLRPRSGG